MENPRPRWSPSTKLVFSLLLLALVLYLLYRFSLVIPPLILAIILAYILSSLTVFLQKRLHIGRGLSILLGYLILLLAFASLPLVLIPTLAAELSGINLDYQFVLEQVEQLLGREVVIAGTVINTTAIIDQIAAAFSTILEPVFTQTIELALNIITSVIWVIFITIVSFYLVRDGHRLRAWIEGLIPPVYRQDYAQLRDSISQIWAAFFRGQLVLSLVVAASFTTLSFALGLPFALGMGVLAGLLELLPSVGHGIWLTLATLLALLFGSTWLPLPNWAFALLIIALHVFFQQFDLNYLIPRIIGRSVHLHPMVVILGIVSGALLGGVLGILLAAPTIASARVLGGYLYANLFDLDPFPDHIQLPALPPPNPYWWRKMKA